MRFGLIFEILRSRFKLIMTIFLITLLSAIAASLMMSKKYDASSVLFVDLSLVDEVSGNTVYSQQSVRNKLSNQIEIIKSNAVVKRAIEILGMDRDPAIIDAWQKDTNGEGDVATWLAPGLARQLDAEPSLDGTTITLEYESHSGVHSAAVVNAFAQAYMAEALELQRRPARESAKYFEEQMSGYKEAVDAAQAKLSAYQKKSGIVATDERFDVENQRLQELSSLLVKAQTELSDAKSRSKTARRRGVSSLPEVVNNPLIQSLKSELSRVEARLGQESAKFGSNHPALRRTKSELGQIRARLGREMRRVAGSLSSSASSATRRVKDLEVAVEKQRTKVLGFKSKRDELAILQRDVDTAQQALDVVTKRARETSLGASGKQSRVSVLTPAVAPLLPSRPNLVLNTAVGAILGLFLGFAAALTLEAAARPLRSSEDLLNAAGVPILAVLPKASSTKAQRLVGITGPAVMPSASGAGTLRLN